MKKFPHRLLAPVRRHASALLLLSLAAAGCTDSVETFPCPGLPVTTIAFKGTRSLVECAAGGPAAGLNSLYPATIDFTGSLSYAASGVAAAICGINPGAEPLVGTHLADLLDVALETRGALVGACNPRCGVTVRQRVSGTLARDGTGAPSSFTGTLTDQATLDGTIAGADCTPCSTPCQATYLLTGTSLVTR